MFLFKKIFFGIPFILFFIVYCLSLKNFLQNPSLILSVDHTVITQFLFLTFSAFFTMFFFVIFATLCDGWKIFLSTLPTIFLSSYLLTPLSLRVIFSSVTCILFILLYASLQKKLDGYITFRPDILLAPSIKQGITVLLLVSSLSLYFSEQKIIQQRGFSFPPGLIETLVQFFPKDQLLPGLSPNQDISQEQLEEVKKNPQLLEQLGIDPALLDQQKIPDNQPQTLVILTTSLQNQMNTLIKPYASYIPFLFSILFFFTIKFFISLLSILLGSMLTFIFWILAKTKYVTYITEVRTVKKLVV